MSAKAHFLNKLHALQATPQPFTSKTEADIAAFRQRIGQLHESTETWLSGTEIKTEVVSVSVTDLLVGNRSFDAPGMLLRYGERTMKFTPLFLYGHGVTGCVEVSLCAEEKVTPLHRLFMRTGSDSGWRVMPAGALSGPERAFDEEAFFTIIASLLP
ncbi:MAG: hypothetical protein E6868_10850 [Pantoea sp.]|uniref:hypothetical protein n=1 Tax=Pantoea sp. TaxID=69393 RepID=UPI0028FE8D9F|nr:hypothetical protein [Pantoea sp.]MDU1573735.1 hypothetical protein [Pantoea sp.]